MPPAPEELLDRLRAAADPGGFLPFDRFQAIALYAPGLGYYRRPGSRFGPAGDFYTSPHLGPLVGEVLADRARTHFEAAGHPARYAVAELGPGDGRLAESLAGELARLLSPETALEYVLVGPGDPYRSGVLARLRELLPPSVRVRSLPELAELGPFYGTIVSNELFDALPARRFLREGGAWMELGVRWRGDRFVEARRPVPRERAPGYLPADAVEGATFELAPLGLALVRQFADQLLAGGALLLDYGDEELRWTGRPSAGTLAAVRGHVAEGDPYADPGEADLSVFVNLDRLRRAGERAGLHETAYGRQAEVLAEWGLPARAARWIEGAPDPVERVRRQLSVKNLAFGFENFRILEWTVPAPNGP